MTGPYIVVVRARGQILGCSFHLFRSAAEAASVRHVEKVRLMVATAEVYDLAELLRLHGRHRKREIEELERMMQ